MRFRLIKWIDKISLPCFVTDLVGNLVYSQKGIRIDYSFPSDSFVISNNSTYLDLWDIDATLACAYIKDSIEFLEESELVKELIKIYPNASPMTSSFIYCPVVKTRYNKTQILSIINRYETKSGIDKTYLIKLLRSIGVIPIPALPKYDSKYYDNVSEQTVGEKLTIVKAGWLHNGEIIRKSRVKYTVNNT